MTNDKPRREVVFLCNNVTCVAHGLHADEDEPARKHKWGACNGNPTVTVRRDGFYSGGSGPYPWSVSDHGRDALRSGDCYVKCVHVDCVGCLARKQWEAEARNAVAYAIRQSRIRAAQDLLHEEPETVLAMVRASEASHA